MNKVQSKNYFNLPITLDNLVIFWLSIASIIYILFILPLRSFHKGSLCLYIWSVFLYVDYSRDSLCDILSHYLYSEK